MTKKQKNLLLRVIIAGVCMIVLALLPLKQYPVVRFLLFLIPYLTVGYDILRKAFKGIRNRQVFDENFLMAVATIGAMALGEYTEGALPELRGRKEPEKYLRAHGHPAGLRESGK